ncbi:MAG: hypothetical protein PHS59_18395, partial [Paludibacter sp.]|nr:hypothetical protein [Paludibacter sp.]
MKNLIVIGTGGFSLDVCWLAERTTKFSVVGILDLSYADGIRESHGFPILGNTEDWPKFEDCEFI